ncbi:GNAT family N-acetyltransferase [Methylotenera versatilis]|jgi:GNAT superfamily N-acetyltransferase|uniref:GCN5-related N-acetyltransferase n=1 Tax=Methylotenera versatilis (strain 301) TaxID=666681 RepID=D7DQB2_METV0|nr:GNAT family N-acetyltransferase [Methylotenera versatilis]ADI29483.1 GCN5-related N-acetyltransferase [Methylotenera versatilis 301]
MTLIEVTDNSGSIIELDWLVKAEVVHRQLRPMLPTDYVARMRVIFANGARLLVAEHEGQVVGLAVWRLVENTYEGLRLYIDDLVTDENKRSTGIGKLLLQHLEIKAKNFGCHVLTLDSGVQRAAAHKFYFREGMHIPSFCFRKSL